MPTNNPITTPAGYAPAVAVGFSDQSGTLSVVEVGKPLPVSLSAQSPTAALNGQTSMNTLVGPFTPVSGRQVILILSGSWEGSVQLERSVDGGTTRHKLTVVGSPWGYYVGNACEVVWVEEEDDAELYLDIAITSGTLGYRIAQ